MKTILKYIPIFLAVLFTLFVVVQYNDPDPEVWMSIYGFAVICSLLVFFNKINKMILVVAIVFYAAGCFYLFPPSFEGVGTSMKCTPNVELARESLGLLICSFAMLFLFFQVRRQDKVQTGK